MERIRRILSGGVISWVAAIAIWQIASLFSKPDFLPGPIATIIGGKELIADGSLVKFILISLRRVFTGWTLGIIVAIPFGLLIGRVRIIRSLAEPLLNFFRFIPALGFVTLFILWFGIGEQTKTILIMYATIFIVMLNTATGVLNVDSDKIRAARCLGASETQILFHVIIPATIPYIFTGVRIAMGNSFMAIVGAEMIAAKEGIGYLIWTSRLYFRTDWIFVGLISLGLMGFFADRILNILAATSLKKYGVTKETAFKAKAA